MSHAETVRRARACTVCAPWLPHAPRPVFVAGPRARILIVGQAPSRAVHRTGVPWNDASGRRLRQWLALSDSEFFDPNLVAILPVGFCYPGSAPSGDRPPRRECAPLWMARLRSGLTRVRLTVAIGGYAQRAVLGADARGGVTEVVSQWRRFAPDYFPIPHPSPRNTAWLQRNSWFEREVVPLLQRAVGRAVGAR